MNALILAAGRGSRMLSLTDERPKCLVELSGRALVDWQIDALRTAGIGRIALLTGYQAQMLAERGDQRIQNANWENTNMVRTLACASDWLRRQPCIVSYGDIVYPTSAVRALMDTDAELALTYDPNWLDLWSRRFDEPLEDAETFRLDAHGQLAEIGHRAATTDEIEGQFMGLVRFTPASWARVERLLCELPPAVYDRLDTTTLLRMLIDQGERITALAVEGPWGEADSATDLAVLESIWPGHVDSARSA